ncbi:MAG: chemotaxis protein CheD [Desulfovibrionaceae bacterium]
MNSELKEYPRVFLHTGDCFVGVQPTLVTTVLGSCVAVTLFCPERAICAVCHAFLPDSRESTRPGRDPQPCRYANDAVENMLSTMTRLGADPARLQVKIMGGSNGLGGGPSGGGRFNIGARNVAMAQSVLEAHGVKVADTHVGGNRGRKIHLLTHTGEIWIKTLNRMASAEALGKELAR